MIKVLTDSPLLTNAVMRTTMGIMSYSRGKHSFAGLCTVALVGEHHGSDVDLSRNGKSGRRLVAHTGPVNFSGHRTSSTDRGSSFNEIM